MNEVFPDRKWDLDPCNCRVYLPTIRFLNTSFINKLKTNLDTTRVLIGQNPVGCPGELKENCRYLITIVL